MNEGFGGGGLGIQELILISPLISHSSQVLELRVGPGVCRMRQDPVHPHVVATGGKENALKVWDLQGSEEPVFRAKNVSDLGPREAGAADHGSETRWAFGDDDGGRQEGAH